MPQLQHRVARTSVLSNTQDLYEVNAVSAFYTIQVGGAYFLAAVQPYGTRSVSPYN